MAEYDETYSTQGPVCPYCRHQIVADEMHYFNQSEYTEDECPRCLKTFMVEVQTSSIWVCEPIEEDE